MTIKRAELLRLLNELLQPHTFNDVAENGLQVEGGDDASVIVTGVTANRALIERAIERKATAIVVHHGLVWGGGIRKLDGWLLQRVKLLVDNGVTLFAYHLPLDAHPEIGNNRGLARALGLADPKPFGRYKGQLIGLQGTLEPPQPLAAFSARARENVVGAEGSLYCFGDPSRVIRSVGLCTGGAPDLLYEAVGLGLDCYVTGEVTEYVKAVAEESGTCFLGLGHHASERFGARSLAEHLRGRGLDATFIDVENPA